MSKLQGFIKDFKGGNKISSENTQIAWDGADSTHRKALAAFQFLNTGAFQCVCVYFYL